MPNCNFGATTEEYKSDFEIHAWKKIGSYRMIQFRSLRREVFVCTKNHMRFRRILSQMKQPFINSLPGEKEKEMEYSKQIQEQATHPNVDIVLVSLLLSCSHLVYLCLYQLWPKQKSTTKVGIMIDIGCSKKAASHLHSMEIAEHRNLSLRWLVLEISVNGSLVWINT